MKTTKKSLLGLVLALALCAGLLPATAFAAPLPDPAQPRITHVSASVTLPKAGDSPADTSASVSKNAPYELSGTYDPLVWIYEDTWGFHSLDEPAVFEAGKTYTAQVRLHAKGDRFFEPEHLVAAINGSPAESNCRQNAYDPEDYSSCTMQITVKLPPAQWMNRPGKLTDVGIFITPPQAGRMPADCPLTLPGNAPYAPVGEPGMVWVTGQGDARHELTGPFVAGERYQASLQLRTNPDFPFALEDMVVTANQVPTIWNSSGTADGPCLLSFVDADFIVPMDYDRLITDVTATVTAPEEDMAPWETTVDFPKDAPYQMAEGGEITWWLEDAIMPRVIRTPFQADRYYYAEIPVQARPGHAFEFAPLSTRVNGKLTYRVAPTEGARECETFKIYARFYVPASENGTFSDVKNDAYYADAVQWAVKNGITSGTGKTTFGPDLNCTRSQAVTFLWRAAGSPEPQSDVNPFADVPNDAYYTKAVLWAVEQKITSGTGSGKFSPDMVCSRSQIVTFLWRSQGSPAVGGDNPFTDVADNAFYADAVLWAVQNSITKGTGPTTFGPDLNCTRGQIVTFLYRSVH